MADDFFEFDIAQWHSGIFLVPLRKAVLAGGVVLRRSMDTFKQQSAAIVIGATLAVGAVSSDDHALQPALSFWSSIPNEAAGSSNQRVSPGHWAARLSEVAKWRDTGEGVQLPDFDSLVR